MTHKKPSLAKRFAIAVLGAAAIVSPVAVASAAPASAPTTLSQAATAAFSHAPAPAAWTNDVPGGWSKTEKVYYNQTVSDAGTCYTETYGGPRPPHWETRAFTPFFDGFNVIYTPGRAVQWNC